MKNHLVKTTFLSLGTAVLLGMTACGSSNDEEATAPTAATLNSGVAIDGLLSNAKVCIDVNLNDLCDSGEDATTTDVTTGEFSLTSTQSGPLLVVGGNDLGTGLAFTGALKAPQGSTVITPLTSAIQAMIENGATKEKAEESLKAALGIASDVELTKFNPLIEISTDNAAKAKKVLEKQAELQTLVHGVATTLASADSQTTIEKAMQSVFKELTKKYNNVKSEVALDANDVAETISEASKVIYAGDTTKQQTVENAKTDASQNILLTATATAQAIQNASSSDLLEKFNEGIKTANTTLQKGLDSAFNNYVSQVTASGATLPYTVLDNTIDDGKNPGTPMEIRNGGFGSAAAADPMNANRFYALTDRGPNATYTGADGKGKMFPTPEYTPRIGHFEIAQDGSVSLVKEILLKDTNNNNITGLPNPIAVGGTGEIPYDKDGNTLKNSDDSFKTDIFGLDGEGLAVLKDGTFWVSDEYGPHMVHFDTTGKEIGRINPFVDDNRTTINLPAEFKYRRANRGMEGLTITPDQKTLVGIMQSTMDLPTSAVHTSDITRIVTVNLDTNVTSQYLYKQEKAANSNSEIVALSNDSFLVIERDGTFYKDGVDGQKHVYKINLSTGTNLEAITDSGDLAQDATLGLTIKGKTLEEAVIDSGNWDTLSQNHIYPVAKTLVIDMIKENKYPHDKMEGLIVFSENKLGVLNDDDFATWVTAGVLEQKYLDTENTIVDGNTLYVVDANLSAHVPSLQKVGSFDTNTEAASEIVAYDKASKRMFATNGAANKIDIINIADVTSPTLVSQIDLSPYGTGVNSVASYDGKIAVAVEVKSTDGLITNSKGNVVLFDTNGNHQETIEVGYLPDMLTFNEDGTKVIVANEGEPNGDYSVDPIGSIGIITLADSSYVDVNFTGATLTDAADGTPVRLGATPSNDQAKDLEPEYITVSGNYAYVTLQENSAMAKVNLTTNALEYVKSYGAKSYEADSNNTIDIEEDGVISMKSYPGLFGLYMPDSIASYTSNGATYLVTANEGDGREYPVADVNTSLNTGDTLTDEKKISKLTLDSSIADAYAVDNDLKVVIDMGSTTTDGKGTYTKLYTYGARSFSIWDADGDLVWDSGDAISKLVAQYEPELFNQDAGEIDGRSGNKGAEPEALTVGTINGKTYAFVGLERQSAIIVYDITTPTSPTFVDYVKAEVNGDISPEGMKFVSATDSPNGKNLLLVSYEVSGSTVVYEINNLK